MGFGGLGHVAVKIARAMGNRVLVFSTSPGKRAAVEALGAAFVNSADAAAMAAVAGADSVLLSRFSMSGFFSYAGQRGEAGQQVRRDPAGAGRGGWAVGLGALRQARAT